MHNANECEMDRGRERGMGRIVKNWDVWSDFIRVCFWLDSKYNLKKVFILENYLFSL